MTKERRQDLLVVAVVISILLHLGLMFFVRSKVMTHGSLAELRSARREPVRMQDFTLPDDPVRMERIQDILAAKPAPKAEAEEALSPQTPAGTETPLQRPDFSEELAVGLPEVPTVEPLEMRAQFTPSVATASTPAVPPMAFDFPSGRLLTAPAAVTATGPLMPTLFGRPTPDVGRSIPEVGSGAERFGRASKTVPRFEPQQEVLKEVDERLVEAEKEAVRELLKETTAAELKSVVNLATTTANDERWTYFQIQISPRQSLAVVPKDVVILLDASGSLGSDRLGSCRQAAKRILRSAMNSGDRFNLVAFRNRFDYAFTRWQRCTAASFEQADKWLANLTSHGRTDVFATIRSVLTLPRDPARPLIALVVTDGDANSGVSETAEILSQFTALNDGLISVYMYGVNRGANRELIDVLTHGNRGESFIFAGLASWRAGSGLESLSEWFRDPVLSDLRLVFTAESQAEAYPQRLKNLYRGDVVTVTGRVPKGTRHVTFSLQGLNGSRAYDGLFTLELEKAAVNPEVAAAWANERSIDGKLR